LGGIPYLLESMSWPVVRIWLAMADALREFFHQ